MVHQEPAAKCLRLAKRALFDVLTALSWSFGESRIFCRLHFTPSNTDQKRVGRDGKAVHGNGTALLNAGVLDRAKDDSIIFPFNAVKVEFMLQAA